jgi:hypothetical protein
MTQGWKSGAGPEFHYAGGRGGAQTRAPSASERLFNCVNCVARDLNAAKDDLRDAGRLFESFEA